MARPGVLSSGTRVEPRPADRESAAEVHRAVSRAQGRAVILRLADGVELPLSDALVDVLVASAGELSEGHSVTLLPSEVWLSPAEVAELLGLSRPFVVRLLDAGDMPSEHLPGSRHRKVRLADVVEFQARRERRRKGRKVVGEALTRAELSY
jgi:excisionase family DNA binding protein